MRDIFQELYNKVLSLFNSSREEIDPTKNIALNRLRTVLMQDRVGFSERAIQMLKEELILTVEKYMEIDTENFELQIDALENQKTVLNLSIPVLRAKTDDEIDKAIKDQELKTQKKAQEIVKELEGLIKERAIGIMEGEIDSELIEEASKKVEEDPEDIQPQEEDSAQLQEEDKAELQEEDEPQTSEEKEDNKASESIE